MIAVTTILIYLLCLSSHWIVTMSFMSLKLCLINSLDQRSI